MSRLRWTFNSGSMELHNESFYNQSELFIQLGSVRKAETYQVGSKKKWWKCLLVLEKEWGDPSLPLSPWLRFISGSICNPASIHPQLLHAGSKWSFWQCNLAYWNLILCVCVGGTLGLVLALMSVSTELHTQPMYTISLGTGVIKWDSTCYVELYQKMLTQNWNI